MKTRYWPGFFVCKPILLRVSRVNKNDFLFQGAEIAGLGCGQKTDALLRPTLQP